MTKTFDLGHRPPTIALEEWDHRVRLAACYRVVDLLGWSEVVVNHISLRLPDAAGHFLINPYGLTYDEVTASNLVKIDVDGNKVAPSAHSVNPAGFVIHSAIHQARDDAHAVVHTHTTQGIAVATKQQGLRHDSFYAAQLYGQVAYHDYEGLSVRLGERERLVASLGDKPCLILRNHGLLAVGRTLAIAFFHMWRLQRACEAQVLTDAMAGANIPVSAEVALRNVEDANNFGGDGTVADKFFEGLVRKVNRIDGSYAT
ncbi:MAG TPA: class II aldolase/adducin family protein [Chloroflexota bacterium]|nr:class II aldolase/adducin family protein [Chloroflexota bacterium]